MSLHIEGISTLASADKPGRHEIERIKKTVSESLCCRVSFWKSNSLSTRRTSLVSLCYKDQCFRWDVWVTNLLYGSIYSIFLGGLGKLLLVFIFKVYTKHNSFKMLSDIMPRYVQHSVSYKYSPVCTNVLLFYSAD